MLAEWSTERALASLHSTGPAAFKTHIAAGGTPVAARGVMASRLAGSAERLAMAGERETVEATIDESEEIVGWRRVGDGDPCSWCAMLISRGAVYKTAESAGQVVGRAGRVRGNQAMGEGYHDMDGCTVVPLYESEEEPDDVADLYDQWSEVTAGSRSNADALRKWRQYWEHRDDDPADRPEPRPAAAPSPAPAEPVRRDATRDAQQRQHETDIAQIASDLGADLERIHNLGADLETLQDRVQAATAAALEMFSRPQRDDVDNLVILLRRTAAESESEQDLIDAVWRIARDNGATRVSTPDEVALTGGDALGAAPASITTGANRRPLGISEADWKAGRKALVEYRGIGFTGTNSQLRDPEFQQLPHVATRIEHMDRVMVASLLQSDVVLYRGIADVGRVFGSAADGDLTGAQWDELAYMSASAKLRQAREFAEPGESKAGVMELRIRAGVQGVQLSSMADQAEILLQRGLKPRVVEDRGIINGMRYIVVEIP